MRKNILIDIVLNLVILILAVIPVALCYVGNVMAPVMFFLLVIPFCLLAANIWCDLKYKFKFPIWRIFHCSLILIIGYGLDYLYTVQWYMQNGYRDYVAEGMVLYSFLFSEIITVVGLIIYQIIILVGLFMKKREAKQIKSA